MVAVTCDLIIDRVHPCCLAGRDGLAEILPVQAVDQITAGRLARCEKRLRLAVVGQLVGNRVSRQRCLCHIDREFLCELTLESADTLHGHGCRACVDVVLVGDSVVRVLLELSFSELHGNTGQLLWIAVIEERIIGECHILFCEQAPHGEVLPAVLVLGFLKLQILVTGYERRRIAVDLHSARYFVR